MDGQEEQTLETAFEGVEGGKSNIITDESAAEPATEKKWSELGLSEDFDSMDRNSMAQRVKQALFREKQWGSQGREIGGYKKRIKELEDSMRSSLGEKPAEELVSDIGKGELETFYRDFETNPRKAMLDLIKPHLGLRSDEQLKKMVSGITNEILSQYDDYNSEARYKETNQDWSENEEYVKVLAKEENFGDTRSYSERQKFAKLVNENKAVADLTYNYMKCHPTMNFEEAKKIADYQLGAQAATQKVEEGIEKQVNKVKSVVAGGKTQKSATETIDDFDKAFDDA